MAQWRVLRSLDLLHVVGILDHIPLARRVRVDGSNLATSVLLRRVRRLLPASIVCLSAVNLLGIFGMWPGVRHLRRDALGALFQVSNWVQLSSGESYADLQSKRVGLISPLEHYWSLAIEEQFYWVWPLIVLCLVRLARRRGWQLSSLMGALTCSLAIATPVIARVAGPDAAYWATPARAAELLVGAWLATALASGRVQPRRWMAPLGLSAAVAVAMTLPADGGPAYHGAFPVFAVLTGLLLLGLPAVREGSQRHCRPDHSVHAGQDQLRGVLYQLPGLSPDHDRPHRCLGHPAAVASDSGHAGLRARFVRADRTADPPQSTGRHPHRQVVGSGHSSGRRAGPRSTRDRQRQLLHAEHRPRRGCSNTTDRPTRPTPTAHARGDHNQVGGAAARHTGRGAGDDRSVPIQPALNRPVRILVVGDSLRGPLGQEWSNGRRRTPSSPRSTSRPSPGRIRPRWATEIGRQLRQAMQSAARPHTSRWPSSTCNPMS